MAHFKRTVRHSFQFPQIGQLKAPCGWQRTTFIPSLDLMSGPTPAAGGFNCSTETCSAHHRGTEVQAGRPGATLLSIAENGRPWGHTTSQTKKLESKVASPSTDSVSSVNPDGGDGDGDLPVTPVSLGSCAATMAGPAGQSSEETALGLAEDAGLLSGLRAIGVSGLSIGIRDGADRAMDCLLP
jgi:hypothetical protein